MTEAADAKLEPEIGWYAIVNNKGELMTCWWNQDLSPLPEGGYPRASIADLLRDAGRYRWIVNPEGDWANRLDDIYAACNWRPTEGQVDALIDVAIAGESKP
jgi:hypothetical protein